MAGALLGAVGPVHSFRRLPKQAILASAQEIIPIVTELNTAPTWLTLEDNVAFRRIAGRFD